MAHFKELKISSEVIEKLEVQQGGVIFLLGWTHKNSLVCVECARGSKDWDWDNMEDWEQIIEDTTNLLPAGISIIGFFNVCSSENDADEKAKMLFSQLLNNEETSSYEELTACPALAFVHSPLGQVKKSKSKERAFFFYDTLTGEKAYGELAVSGSDKLWSGVLWCRVRGNISLSFEIALDYDSTIISLQKCIIGIRDKISSAATVFRLCHSTVLIQNNSEANVNHPKIHSNSKCLSLVTCCQEERNCPATDVQVLDFTLLHKTTGADGIRQSVSCVPTVRYERKKFKAITMNESVDVMVAVPSDLPVSNLPSIFVSGLCRQLVAMQNSLSRLYKENSRLFALKVYHFLPHTCSHFVTLLYPEGVVDEELESYRQEMHTRLLLSTDRPHLRRIQSFSTIQDTPHDPRLQNVHRGLATPSMEEGSQMALVHGTYTYHHYMQDGMNDDGWGCAYRSLQTLISWFRHQGYTNVPIPTHAKIQQTLVDLGDKPPSFVHSRQWIGSLEVSYCLEQLAGITSKIMFVSSGEELANKGWELLNHFTLHGTPIMIGGGVLAHTILGVHFNRNTGNIRFLILDPHYTGGEDLGIIQRKGWCGWKGQEFWNPKAFYNLCCPQRPRAI